MDERRERINNMNSNKGILIVSSGTSHEDTRKKTICTFEDTIRNAYPDIPVYTAWTSQAIITKLLNTTGEKIYGIDETLYKMKQDGLTHIYILPTLIIDGMGYNQIKESAARWMDAFAWVTLGKPLLSTREGRKELIRIIADEFSEILASDQSALILIGHGTPYRSNTDYAKLGSMFREAGYANIYVQTLESCRSAAQMISLLKYTSADNIHLSPLMITAGSHAKNDIFGPGKSSWAAQFKQAGYNVTCHLKGLGEYPAIHRLFLKHLSELSGFIS